ncbi:glycoside hydrolase family 2 protein [Ideonella sp.]|uniref:glycoside hydrolase family 2 protein n=1 Tax=Ideonella sp. TaxID=1929293 RepID=UPI002B46E6E6|nr:glycoside hydrolase family 2 TIM barrel-domain containing protein [Ideonella sp.]HJV69225.1 glycoside hydrolase family 2 TIM barrel-domain containing protein [Ideonella sp.]
MRGRLLRCLLALCCIALNVAPAAAEEPARLRQSFNAGWRFHLGDAAGAEVPGFDDAGWERVGLPHSFSIPYFQSPAFYVGFGWYRKTLVVEPRKKWGQTFLEFEGAFQDAEVFVNGVKLARHRGGYTGFPVNITAALRPGSNLIAVRVNNKWDPTLAPRAGEHVFGGGLYRDVWLVQTDDVHVPWSGTFVTTPELSAERGHVALQTEIRNDGSREEAVTVLTDVFDAKGRKVASLPRLTLRVLGGQTVTAHQRSGDIPRPELWSPETPVLYRAATSLVVGGRTRDRFDTEFGFRWFSWTADQGFFLNGKHRYFRGANVHQDQAGWGDAVTNGAIERDVALIKEAGFDFIRGSHYPHDPHFSEATDRIGLLFLSEAPFWGTAYFNNDWSSSAYPTDPAHRASFDASVKQQLAEMIRIHRNHPSIVAWSMGNEVFFTAEETLPEARRLLKEMVALTHELDPTRPAAASGVQRGDLDHLGDIAGYNGDGAVLFPNPGVPNFVAEYGSTIADRPGRYDPGWGDLERTPGAVAGRPETWRPAWRSGEAIWAGFDHGSIAGRQFGSMGIIDYSRLPKRAWHWYRNAYRGIAPPDWPTPGRAAALRLSSSAPVIRRADGTDDVQVVITVVDADGRALSNTPPVRLQIESGPGELPTGRHIDFAADSDIPIRDGKAAIALRSWQSGVSRLRATSPGLQDATLEIRALEGPPFEPGVTPLAADRPYRPSKPAVAVQAQEQVFGTDNPTDASSAAAGHSPRLVNDGDAATCWAPAPGDADGWVSVDPERVLNVTRLVIMLPMPGQYAFRAELQAADGGWAVLLDEPVRDVPQTTVELPTPSLTGRKIRLRVRSAAGEPACVSEMRVAGRLNSQ